MGADPLGVRLPGEREGVAVGRPDSPLERSRSGGPYPLADVSQTMSLAQVSAAGGAGITETAIRCCELLDSTPS